MVIEREKSPGPYWFAMAMHALITVISVCFSAMAW